MSAVRMNCSAQFSQVAIVMFVADQNLDICTTVAGNW